MPDVCVLDMRVGDARSETGKPFTQGFKISGERMNDGLEGLIFPDSKDLLGHFGIFHNCAGMTFAQQARARRQLLFPFQSALYVEVFIIDVVAQVELHSSSLKQRGQPSGLFPCCLACVIQSGIGVEKRSPESCFPSNAFSSVEEARARGFPIVPYRRSRLP